RAVPDDQDAIPESLPGPRAPRPKAPPVSLSSVLPLPENEVPRRKPYLFPDLPSGPPEAFSKTAVPQYGSGTLPSGIPVFCSRHPVSHRPDGKTRGRPKEPSPPPYALPPEPAPVSGRPGWKGTERKRSFRLPSGYISGSPEPSEAPGQRAAAAGAAFSGTAFPGSVFSVLFLSVPALRFSLSLFPSSSSHIQSFQITVRVVPAVL